MQNVQVCDESVKIAELYTSRVSSRFTKDMGEAVRQHRAAGRVKGHDNRRPFSSEYRCLSAASMVIGFVCCNRGDSLISLAKAVADEVVK